MYYYFEEKFGAAAGIQIQNAMRSAQNIGTSYNAMQRSLISQGMGYNRQQMQTDYRKFQAIDRSHTPEGKAKAEKWFRKVYEPLRKEKGTKEATALIKAITEGTIETMKQAKEAGQYAELYETMSNIV